MRNRCVANACSGNRQKYHVAEQFSAAVYERTRPSCRNPNEADKEILWKFFFKSIFQLWCEIYTSDAEKYIMYTYINTGFHKLV